MVMIKMFSDKTKLNRVYLDELTKIGNLFDTIGIGYSVVDKFALLAYGINSKGSAAYTVLADAKHKNKIFRTLFKLNYIISKLTSNSLTISKTVKSGDLSLNIIFAEHSEKMIIVEENNNKILLPPKTLTQDRKEVETSKSGRGYFRVAPLEVAYFIRMNHKDEYTIQDLELIKGSGKLDFDKLLKLFEINGLV